MKRRLLPLLLALVMALSLTVPALADDDAVDFSNINSELAQSGTTHARSLSLKADEDPILVEKVTTYHWNSGLGTENVGKIIIDEYEQVNGTWKKVQNVGS